MRHDGIEKSPLRRMPRPRATAAMALIASAALVAGTPTASRGAEPQEGPRTEARRSGPAPVPVQAPSVVLVTPSGDAHLVLRAGFEQLDGGVVWHVAYLAGVDPDELARPEAEARRAAVARDLADAFRPLAEAAQAKLLAVTAVVGRPGEGGRIEQRAFVRDAGAWHAEVEVRHGTIEQLPRLGANFVRDPDEEAGARAAAAEFLADASRADYDAAWARTSAVVKVTMSRTEFEHQLGAMGWREGPRDAKLFIAFPASLERFLPGTVVEAWIAPEGADHGIRALALRLDDDMEWRVAGVAQVTSPAAPSALPAGVLNASNAPASSSPAPTRHSAP